MLLERALQAVDRLDLRRAQRLDRKHRQVVHLGPPGRMVRVFRGCPYDTGQRVRSREVEDPAGAGLGVVPVGELGFAARRLEYERQPAVVGQRLQPHLGPQPVGVLGRLPLHTGQGRALRLRLDHPDDMLVDVEQIIGPAVPSRHHLFADGDSRRGIVASEKVLVLTALDVPTGLGQLTIDLHPRALFRRQPAIVPHAYRTSRRAFYGSEPNTCGRRRPKTFAEVNETDMNKHEHDEGDRLPNVHP